MFSAKLLDQCMAMQLQVRTIFKTPPCCSVQESKISQLGQEIKAPCLLSHLHTKRQWLYKVDTIVKFSFLVSYKNTSSDTSQKFHFSKWGIEALLD